MDTIKLYGLMNSDDILHPYFITSTDDKEACKFIVKYLNDTLESIPDDKEKALMVDSVRSSLFVRVGYVDLVSHHLVEDFNVLLDLSTFGKEKYKEYAKD